MRCLSFDNLLFFLIVKIHYSSLTFLLVKTSNSLNACCWNFRMNECVCSGENSEDEIKARREIDEEDGNGSQKSRRMERNSEKTAPWANPEGQRRSTKDGESP